LAPSAELSVQERELHARDAWQLFAERWHLYAGTSSGYWFVRELRDVFGISQEFSAAAASDIYDQISALIASAEFRPRELFKTFNIELLATTDSPADSLESHAALAELDLGGRVVPTLRPDAYLNPLASGWAERVQALTAQTGHPCTQAGLVESLAARREFFKAHGSFSIDIGAESAYTTILSSEQSQRLFEGALTGTLSPADALTYRGHMIGEMIRLSCDDGLVVTLHVGVHRNHSTETFQKFGADTGHDIPLTAEFTKNLHPVLERYGLNPNLHLVLFSLDETTWAREVAPLAGFYPSVFVGAPWWFLDAPAAARRFREAVTDTAGFYRGSGFIDDTRAFLSIPARHDMARRVDSAFLGDLVAQRRVTLAEAEQIIVDTVTRIPKRAFKL
jgi:glucuronate isomerase